MVLGGLLTDANRSASVPVLCNCIGEEKHEEQSSGSHTGLEQHGESIMTDFSFWDELI